MKKLKIKKGDTVQVTAGTDKGRSGSVLHVNSKTMKITVQGVRMQVKNDKKEGRSEREGSIDYSNVKLVEAAAAKKKKKKTSKKKAAAKA